MILKKTTFTLLFLLSFQLLFSSTKLSSQFFDEADIFFKRYISEGKVNYSAIQDENGIDSLISQVQEMDLSEATLLEKKAFYINAYNLTVISKVVEDFPIETVLPGNDSFFASDKITVAGEEITLNILEHNRLIGADNDARIHFVVVCAAISCPPINNEAYRPEILEDQLNERTSLSINDSEFTRVNFENKSIELSMIFNWFEDDFGGSTVAVLEFINQFRNTPIETDFTVLYYFYDWNLNEFMGEPNGLFNQSVVETLVIRDNKLYFNEYEGNYTFINLNGVILLEGVIRTPLDLTDFQSGIYVIKIQSDDLTINQRVYIE